MNFIKKILKPNNMDLVTPDVGLLFWTFVSFAILYFTGSSEFNVRMREDALANGYTMNEYSMKHTVNKEIIDHNFTTEKEIFDFMGYDYLEPEMRIQ